MAEILEGKKASIKDAELESGAPSWADILESIYYPSKVISDQYRSVTIVTTKGQQVHGLAAVEASKAPITLTGVDPATGVRRCVARGYQMLTRKAPRHAGKAFCR